MTLFFVASNKNLYGDFVKVMQSEFEISMMSELKYLQIRKNNEDIFISQQKYMKSLLERFNMHECKSIS